MIDPQRWPEADALLDRALDLPVAEREPYLTDQAGADPELLAELLAVVREASEGDGFLAPDAHDALRSAACREMAGVGAPTLEIGSTFLSCEVLALVGRGGMGEVYRARDRRLGRTVALKVLSRHLVRDEERLARFEREARVLASLNHPNIAAIHGLGEHNGHQALVLEFVEGATLAERLASGPVPVGEALSIARQVALALEAAHRRGIVHRDLKPANIAVTADGTAKVLDFGLAKAVRDDAVAAAPHVTSVIVPGALIGTPAYMAPEQARGHAVDQRADVWAFGCVLFEMLAGARAFPGTSAPDVLARVIGGEPDFSLLPPRTPDAIVRLLRRTLAGDPDRRLPGMADALLEIDEGLAERRRWTAVLRRHPVAIAAAFTGMALLPAGATLWMSRDRPPDAPVTRLAVPVPPSDALIVSAQQVLALSPDGQTLVYRASRDGAVGLFKRTLSALESTPIAGTGEAAGPFFSPDGKWLGFDGEGVLQRVSLAGGSPVTICDAPGGASASWGGDVIVFSTTTARVLQRVSPFGGSPVPVTELDTAAGDLAHTFPYVMPDGRSALFTIVRADGRHIASVDLETRQVHEITGGSQPRYLAGTGHLLLVRDETLWAAPFDAVRLRLTGEPMPVLEDLDTAGGSAAHFAVSRDGLLVYAPARQEVSDRRLVWIDRRGRESDVPLPPRRYLRASLSPDGQRIAVALSDSANTSLWIADTRTGGFTRLTTDPATETAPLWSPDGRSVVFRSDRTGGGLFRRAADATGAIELLTASTNTIHTPHGWTPDGRTLLFTEFKSYGQQTIAAIDPGRPDTLRRVLDGRFAQLRPQISPDGRWLAYQSDESGHFEIYVRPWPDVNAGRWQVSTGGGTTPRWARSGRELFFFDGRGIAATPVHPAPTFQVGRPIRLFEISPFGSRLGPDFDVTPDGTRFLMIRAAADTPSSRVRLVIVQNWIRELLEKTGRSGLPAPAR